MRFSTVLIFISISTLIGCGGSNNDNKAVVLPTTKIGCPNELTLPMSLRDSTICEFYDVPLRRDRSDSPQIEVMVMKLAATASPVLGDLWILDGGPGGTGLSQVQPEVVNPPRAAGYNVYIPQHRGTGHSTPLNCAAFAKDLSKVAECGAELAQKWGDGLAGFTAYGAAQDVGFLIEKNRGPEDKVFVYGISYGTYLGMRYLQYFPDQASGVILDGVLALSEQVELAPANIEGNLNDVGLALLARCDLDAACSQRMGEPAADALQRAITSAATGSCAAFAQTGVSKANIQDAMVGLLGNKGAAAIPAIAYRLARCDQGAINFVKSLVDAESSEGAIGKEDEESEGQAAGPYSNNVLAFNVQFMEMDKGDYQNLKAHNTETDLFYSGNPSDEDSSVSPWPWPDYALPEVPALTLPKTPVLLLNGKLDTSTTANQSRIVEYVWKEAGIDSLWFPNSGHGVYSFSECPNKVLLSFMDSPWSGPDASCIDAIPELDFINATLEQSEYKGLLNGPLWGSDF